MAELTDDSNNQTYIYHQLTIHNSHDSEDDFRSGCRNVSQCQQQLTVLFRTTLSWSITLDRQLSMLLFFPNNRGACITRSLKTKILSERFFHLQDIYLVWYYLVHLRTNLLWRDEHHVTASRLN